MKLSLAPDSGVPIYLQIKMRIQEQVMLGEVLAGERLPTIREMAAMLDVNPNTVARAYRELVAVGFLSARPGNGTVVAESKTNLGHEDRIRFIGNRLDEVIRLAAAVGMARNEVIELWEDRFGVTESQKAPNSTPLFGGEFID